MSRVQCLQTITLYLYTETRFGNPWFSFHIWKYCPQTSGWLLVLVGYFVQLLIWDTSNLLRGVIRYTYPIIRPEISVWSWLVYTLRCVIRLFYDRTFSLQFFLAILCMSWCWLNQISFTNITSYLNVWRFKTIYPSKDKRGWHGIFTINNKLYVIIIRLIWKLCLWRLSSQIVCFF